MTTLTAPAVLAAGGDLRQKAAAESLAADFCVALTGFDRLRDPPCGVRIAVRPADLPYDADILLLPMPATADGEQIPAPFGSCPLHLSELLTHLREGALVCGGRFSAADRRMIEAAGCIPRDLAACESFALRNAVPTAEGALLLALRELPVTLHGLPCLILGAGRISQALQPRLRALGAEVCVAARRFPDLARRHGGEGKPPLFRKIVHFMRNIAPSASPR